MGPVMLWNISVSRSEFKSKFPQIHCIALFKNLLNAQGEALHPKVSA